MSYLEELLPEFRKGAKIRRKDWDDDVFIYFYNDEIYWKDSGAWKNGEIASTKDLVSLFTLHHNDWEFYQEPIDYNYIIKNKCLCWFWDNEINIPQIANCLKEIRKDLTYSFITNSEHGWKHCRPVRRDEVTFYEERKDE